MFEVSKQDAALIRDAASAMDEGRASLNKLLTVTAVHQSIDPVILSSARQDVAHMVHFIESLHLLANRLLGELPDHDRSLH